MKTLFSGADIVNVFTGELEEAAMLVEDGRIIGVGDYGFADADCNVDVSGKFICPGFIDGHIHIESSFLTPAEFARSCLPHGTTAVVADPHEIANVCGGAGIEYMLEASKGLPLHIFIALPSCVPCGPFDEAGSVIDAAGLKNFYSEPRVISLGEMMNYPGVINEDPDVMRKISDALAAGRPVDGHAPMICGRDIDKYIASGISSDHECSSAEEAIERIRKGQWLMIREGTAARNLTALLPLFDEKYCHRCLLVTDDKHPADLLGNGHIDHIIRKAAEHGKSAITAITMATINAASRFKMTDRGAIAPGYKADFLILGELDKVSVEKVFVDGKLVSDNGRAFSFEEPQVSEELKKRIFGSFNLRELSPSDFDISKCAKARVIRIVPGGLITKEWQTEVNGIDTGRDILKLAVIERHHATGHIGLGYINGLGLKRGAIASSVSHDSHNLIVAGADEADMALAANRVRELGGGQAVAENGRIIAEMPLPVAGLMSELPAAEVARLNSVLRETVHSLGAPEDVEPFMNLAFISLPVIPDLKLTTLGLVDVINQRLVSLSAE